MLFLLLLFFSVMGKRGRVGAGRKCGLQRVLWFRSKVGHGRPWRICRRLSQCLSTGPEGSGWRCHQGEGRGTGLSQECRNHDPDVDINNNSRRRYFYGWKGQWVTRRMPALSPWIHPSLPSRVFLQHERPKVPATVLGAGGVVLNTTYPVPAFMEPAG